MSPASSEGVPGSGVAARSAVTTATRVVVKIGSSSLTSVDGGLDQRRLEALVEAVVAVRRRGAEVVLVSSGAIAAGLSPLGLTRRPRDLATQQAAAAVGQGLLVQRYTEALAHHGVRTGQVLLTAEDVTRRGHYRNAHRTFARLLELGVVPVVNENDTVATAEIRFGDNDRLAALVAHLVHADLLVLLSDVDGLHDGPPTRPGSRLLTEVAGDGDLAGLDLGASGDAGVGTGGMRTKVQAARIATGSGIPVVLGAASDAGRVLAGEEVGTIFRVTGRRRPTRLLWLAHATEGAGRLHLDAGAVRAVVGGRASLLPVGVVRREGDFSAGDPVDLVSPDGVVVARGLVSYDAEEVDDVAGRTTAALSRMRGAAYERELVHRDDLVLLDPPPGTP